VVGGLLVVGSDLPNTGNVNGVGTLNLRLGMKDYFNNDAIMTAVIYLDIFFNISSPISKFLPCPSLKYLTAFNMIKNLSNDIKSRRNITAIIFINLYSKS
jgi:hypothetical protein